MDIVQISPRELRVVSGAGWSVPVFCDPYSSDGKNVTHCKIQPALELLSGPWQELSSVFSPVNLSESRQCWIIVDELAEKLTKKVSGCIPGDYLKWSTMEPTDDSAGMEIVEEKIEKDEPFLKFVCKKSGMDMVLGRYFWAAMRKSLVDWLVNHQKPVNFGPFTVHPVPYRANWKEIMLAKHPASVKIMTGKLTHKQVRNEMLSMGFISDLGSTDLLSMSRHGFKWGLEVRESQSLIDVFEAAESERLAMKKPVRYAKYYEGAVRSGIEGILLLYQSWCHKIRQPVGELCESAVSGKPFLRPANKFHKVLPFWGKRPDIAYQSDGDLPTLKSGQEKEPRMDATTEGLLSLPPVQQRVEDMRRCQKPNLESIGRRNGANGMFLLHAPEGKVTEVNVLDTGEESGE